MRRIPLLLVTCLTAIIVIAVPVTDADEEQVVQIGLRLFRTLLAADEDLTQKVGPDGVLELVLLHRGDARAAESFAEALGASGHGDQQGTVKGIELRVRISDDPTLAAFSQDPPAGVYLVQRLSDQALSSASGWAAAHHRLLFSPFDGDVERGASAGVAIGVRVQPYLNRPMLDRSGVRLKDLLFKVSKIHG